MSLSSQCIAPLESMVMGTPTSVRWIAPLLATVAAGLLLSTLVLPIKDYERMGDPITLLDLLTSPFVILGVLVVLLWTGAAWILATRGMGGRLLWAAGALVAGLAVASLYLLIGDMPIMWDGVDKGGRPTGGMETAEPAIGVVPLALASLGYLAAAAAGLMSGRRTPAPL